MRVTQNEYGEYHCHDCGERGVASVDVSKMHKCLVTNMNKVEFPLGVELPLREGGVAVLYEFFEGRWYGRCKGSACDKWAECSWGANGACRDFMEKWPYDILPPKRKAWVVWYPDVEWGEKAFTKPAEIVGSAEYASLRAKELGGRYQEITEP